MDAATRQSGAGPDPWRVVSDAVLRGLNHALSNRITALSAVSALVEPDTPPGASVARMLAAEAGRLEGVLRLLRLLPGSQSGADVEPVLVADALADALALHAHHAGLEDRVCAVEGDRSSLLPVLAPPVGLTHALVLLLGAAAEHARARGAQGVLHLAGDARAVRLAVELGDAPAELAPDAVAEALQHLLGGARAEVAADDSLGIARVELTLPTIAVRDARA